MTTPQEQPDGHTKGPWKACGTIYEHMNAEIRSGAKGEGQGIAQIWDGPNAFKDALLMAASPEMVAALKALVDLDLTYNGASIVIPTASHADAIQIVSEARAAMAKALGQ